VCVSGYFLNFMEKASDLLAVFRSLLPLCDKSHLEGRSILQRGAYRITLTAAEARFPTILINDVGLETIGSRSKSFRGLEVKNIRAAIGSEPEAEYLAIVCRDATDSHISLFMFFLESLIRDCSKHPSKELSAVIKEALSKWRLFWSPTQIEFTEEWIKGLWGELFVLQSLVQRIGPKSVVHWTGPEGFDQDFQGGGVGLEIKTTSTVPPVLQINGLAQLDRSLFSELYLGVCLISADAKGMSVSNLVDELWPLLSADDELLDVFVDKLNSVGYRPQHRESYETYRYRSVAPPTWLHVDENFPAITPSSFRSPLDARIRGVKWSAGTKLESKNLRA